MTVVVEQTATTAIPESSREPLAPWHLRAGAFAVDVLPVVAVATTMVLVSFTVPTQSVWRWLCVSVAGLAVLLGLNNRSLLHAITGWSLGRGLFGITVVRRDGADAGPWLLLLRDLAHLLDTASVVGWLWPLWDSRRRTFADVLLGTEVRSLAPDKSPANVRRWTAIALLSAAALCVAGIAMSYFLVDSQERAAERTHAQIATQGPKIVAQMLTYDPKSLQDDFARALSLTTDRYRGKLATQQDVVKKGTPVINEYRVVDSSVESAKPNGATMLLFMRGQRGAGPEAREISATVRVNFAKGGNGRWLVDDLTVLTKPKPPGGGK